MANPKGRMNAYKLTEEQTKVRNENKTKNLIVQANHCRASSNINSIGCIERYEDVEYRFCKYLGENTELKNLKNVSARHIYPYVESLFDRDCKQAISAPKWRQFDTITVWRTVKNILPSNKDLGISEKNDYEFDRSFLPAEFDAMIKAARSMNRYDVVIEAYLARYFGLRFEEAATLRLFQLEEAICYRQLHVTNTKGGLTRDIQVDIPVQKRILKELVAYLRTNGKKSKNYLICDNHKHSVKKKKLHCRIGTAIIVKSLLIPIDVVMFSPAANRE